MRAPISGWGDGVELLPLLVVGERLRRERRPVERSVGGQDLLPEGVHQLAQAFRSGFHHLAGDLVGIDKVRAPRSVNVLATVDLPAPMPPVNPTLITPSSLADR